jgi:hypothetical protein
MKTKEIASKANKQKAQAGSKSDKLVNDLLKQLLTQGFIKSFTKSINVSHPKFGYQKQFLANFLIETHASKFIVIRSSTSFRHDRAKIGFYDFEGILKYSAFSNEIIASIYLLPDSELGNPQFLNTRERIKKKEYYCPATHLLTISEFISFIEGYKYDILNSFEVEKTSLPLSAKELGSFYGKRGNAYERELVETLSENTNLVKLKQGSLSEKNVYKIVLMKILKDKGISEHEIIKVSATNSVPLLMNGGTPKTDIIITIEDIKNNEYVETVSIKNTDQKRVSCHDYTSSDFIRILKCEDTKLSQYLNLFQEEPTIGTFIEKLPNGFSNEEFTKLLSKKSEVLMDWVLRGMNDEYNLTVPLFQVSNYLLIFNNQKVSFYHMSDYISKINETSKKTFGIPLGWTYPSKQRGKRIQLKLPILP